MTSSLPWKPSLALAGSLFLILSGLLRADETSRFGVNIHAPGESTRERLLAEVQGAGIGFVRVDFVWAAIETQRGVFDWALYDRLVWTAQSRGIQILANIAYSPAWATDGPLLSGIPREVTDWEDFCFRAAERYRGAITYWEVWNEPNLSQFFAGDEWDYVNKILRPAAGAIRAANPAARIGGPALAHLKSADWYSWLLDVLRDANDQLDFVTHHTYGSDARTVGDRLNGSTQFANIPQLWDLLPPSTREVLKTAGWYPKEFWLTETGWASDVTGEAGQAAQYRRLLSDWFAVPTWVRKVFFYELQDGASPGARWGLLREDGSEKPAYGVYRDWSSQHPAGSPLGSGLDLLGGRFQVNARWRNPRDGAEGAATGVGYSDATGLSWFFGPQNIELLVKVLDGRTINGRFWVFFGALSDVEYWVEVTDTVTRETREYHNPPGTFCGQADTAAFPLPQGAAASEEGATPAPETIADLAVEEVLAAPATACSPGPSNLCLRDSRFRVRVDWHDQHNERTGPATAIAAGDDSGYFWFFAPDNLELVVKVLDGRGVNGNFWVFYGGLSDVEYWVRVTDTVSGKKRVYHNAPGNYCGKADTGAF